MNEARTARAVDARRNMLAASPVSIAAHADGKIHKLDDAPPRLIQALTVSVFIIALTKRLAGVSSENFIGTWSDDFYYYLKTAMNIVAGKGSTFDGTILTNGYHPLWMALLVLLVAITGSGVASLTPLACVVAITTAATFWLSHRLAALLLRRSGAISLTIALYSTIYFYMIAKHGMEINLTVPLMMYAALRVLLGTGKLDGARDAVITGALCGAIVLSRTDSIIFVGFYLAGLILSRRPSFSELTRAAVWFAVGFSPVFVYLATNVHYFGGLLPVSGAAKQLGVDVWKQIKIRGFEFSNRLHFVLVFPGLAANLGGLAALIAGHGGESKTVTATALLPVLLFPEVFYLLQICMNDWPFWDWYLYPWMAALPIAAALTTRLVPGLVERVDLALIGAERMRLIAGCGLAVLIGMVSVGLSYRTPLQQAPMHSFAAALTEFSRTHPGRYAMGDRAGVVGFLLPFPLLQLEGLVEDRAFLEHIRSRRPLAEVLREYEIDYYASGATERVGDCYQTTEPWQPGPASPRMVGRFCQEPLLVHEASYNRTLVFQIKRTP